MPSPRETYARVCRRYATRPATRTLHEGTVDQVPLTAFHNGSSGELILVQEYVPGGRCEEVILAAAEFAAIAAALGYAPGPDAPKLACGP